MCKLQVEGFGTSSASEKTPPSQQTRQTHTLKVDFWASVTSKSTSQEGHSSSETYSEEFSCSAQFLVYKGPDQKRILN